MADKYLLSTGTDLSAGASYSGGTIPVNGDNLFIVEGNQAVVSGLSGLSAVTLNRLVIASTFGGRIGGPGAIMTLAGVTVDIALSLAGWDFYLNPGTAAWLTLRETLNGTLTLTGGTVADLVGRRGKCDVLSAAAVTRLHGVGAEVYAEEGATAFTAVNVRAGRVRSARETGDLTLSAGNTDWLEDAEITGDLRIHGGQHHHAGGDIGNLFGFGGQFRTFDLAKARAITGDLHRYRGFGWYPKDGAGSISVSGDINDYGYDSVDGGGTGVKG